MKVKCINPNFKLNTFTHNKIYEANHHINDLYKVTDNLGRLRYISLNRPCPHLWDGINTNRDMLGHWEQVK